MITPDNILAAARECLSTPFVHQGRIAGVALDCAGVVCHVATRLGYTPTAPLGYSRVPADGLLERTLDEQPYLVRIPVADAGAGDVFLMRFVRNPQHLAICTGGGLVHAWQDAGKCCEHDLDARWRSRIVRAYRFKEIA